MLRLATFGGVSLRPVGGNSGAEQKSLPRRGLAVLVLLAAGPASGVSRDTVVAYLWPESDEERARGALRQTLFALRRDLGRPDLLLGGPDLILNPAALTSDVRELHIARAAGDLERVVELQAGPFLDGFHLPGVPEFEHWVDRQRIEYAAWAAVALQSLARGAATRGDHPAAAEWWRRLVAADPLNTRAVVESMQAQASSGNAAGALRQAQEHEELLSRELGTTPDRALSELVARIRTGERLSGPHSLQREGPSHSPPPAAPAPRPTGAERFQDRLARELGGRYVLEDEARDWRRGWSPPLPGPRPAARAPGHAEGGASRAGFSDRRRALRARDPPHREAVAPAHPAAARFRRGRRTALVRRPAPGGRNACERA